MLSGGASFDWAAFFSAVTTIIVAVVVPWMEFKRRETAEQIKLNTEITEENALRSKQVMVKVEAIAKQTDGMAKHLEAVARRQGVIEGIEASDRAAAIAKEVTTGAVARVAEKLEELKNSSDDSGSFDDLSAELRTLMRTMSTETKRINRPPGPQ